MKEKQSPRSIENIMNQDNVSTAFRTLKAFFHGKIPTLEQIDGFKTALTVYPYCYSQEEILEAIRQYKINCGITMDPGELLAIKHQDDQWYDEYKKDKLECLACSRRS